MSEVYLIKTGDHHIFLYAKGHYKETDVVSDLKKIMAHRCGLSVEHVQLKDIVLVLLGVAFDIMQHEGLNEQRFTQFVGGLGPSNWMMLGFSSDQDWDYLEAVCKQCLSVIRFTRIDYMETPLSSILPLTKEVQSGK